MSDRTDPAVPLNVGARIGRPVRTIPSDAADLARRIDEAYSRFQPVPNDHADVPRLDSDAPDSPDSPAEAERIERLLSLADQDLLSTSGKSPVVRLVDAILFEALSRAASDVHVHPLADRTLVRYRVDGVLHTARTLPARLAAPVLSRVKVMGSMDIAERRVPQDGRATVRVGSGGWAARTIDLRISTFPTPHGERGVLRLLEAARTAHPPPIAQPSDSIARGGTSVPSAATPAASDRDDPATPFAALGMSEPARRAFLDRASRPSGIVLVTGPTGSGKTTTLYTTLRWLATTRNAELNIMTIEDPIEYELSAPGIAISQGQVNTRKGITFANGLRHILRQDPDVIMVGEVRDAETARTAIQASLTGHLVFSTLHTNDAPSAVTRLADLGIEPYLLSASLSCVLAQRLVRRAHLPCSARGCPACFSTGLLGRTAVFELLLINDELRDLIASDAAASRVRELARRLGMRTLEDEGRRLVAAGVTTRAEAARVLCALDDDRASSAVVSPELPARHAGANPA